MHLPKNTEAHPQDKDTLSHLKQNHTTQVWFIREDISNLLTRSHKQEVISTEVIKRYLISLHINLKNSLVRKLMQFKSSLDNKVINGLGQIIVFMKGKKKKESQRSKQKRCELTGKIRGKTTQQNPEQVDPNGKENTYKMH